MKCSFRQFLGKVKHFLGRKILGSIKSFSRRKIFPTPVSVIVPVYNSEKTIEKCLNSLIGQSQKRIRIICVNDGSTDNSLLMLKEYEKKDKRITVINQKNRGRSASRNAGLKIVKTKYVMFCDADDEYDFQMCERMIDKIEAYNVDLVVCGIEMKYDVHNEMKDSDDDYYRIKYQGKWDINDEIISKTDASICNKIFRMKIIDQFGISFPNGLNNEDYYFYNAYMSVVKTIYYTDQKLYFYTRHDGSIMSNNFEKKGNSIDHLLVAEKLFDYYKENGFLKEHKDLFWQQWVASFWFSFEHSDKKYYLAIKKQAMSFLDRYYEKNKPQDEALGKCKDDIEKVLDKIK